MKEFGEGSRKIIVSHDGLGHQPALPRDVPKSAAIGTLEAFHWVFVRFHGGAERSRRIVLPFCST